LSGSTATFRWSGGVGVSQYKLKIGSTRDGSDLHLLRTTAQRSVTVTGLPTDGRVIHVRLLSWKQNTWKWHDYTLRAARR
jgi:hypothetical protein